MRAVLITVLDGLVGDEPGVAAAAAVAGRAAPALHVRRVLVGDTDGLAIERRLASDAEVEDELVTVVHEPLAVDRLVVPDAQVAVETGGGPRRVAIDCNRLDPVNGVLQRQVTTGGLRDVERCPGVRRLGADVQEQRALRPDPRAAAFVQASVQSR